MFIARLYQCSRKKNLVHNKIEKKTNKTSFELVDQHEALALVLRSSSSERLPKKILQCGTPFSSQVSLLSFFPKVPLNRSRNPIPIWRKSQIFRLQLTENFGPFNFIIQTFGKLQSFIPFN